MGKTIAEALREEGKKEGKRQGRKEGEIRARRNILLRQLRLRFGELSPEAVETITATKDIERLDAWLERTVTAKTLAEVRIGPTA